MHTALVFRPPIIQRDTSVLELLLVVRNSPLQTVASFQSCGRVRAFQSSALNTCVQFLSIGFKPSVNIYYYVESEIIMI